MKRYFSILLLFTSLLAYGQQNVTFEKKNFKSNPDGFKKAMDSLLTGDNLYQQGPAMYDKALPYYMSAEHFNPDNSELNYRIAVCLLSPNSQSKTEALSYIQKALDLDPDVALDAYYQLGRAYHLNMSWENAKMAYNEYMKKLEPKRDAEEVADVKKKVEECNNGEALMRNPVRVSIENLGPNINTPYPEYGILVNADETEMIFTARRPTTMGGQINTDDGQYQEDLYVSYFKNGVWTPAEDMGTNLNSNGSDATAGLSPDGQTLYIYRENNGGDIYESQLNGSNWGKPVLMSNKINSNYHESTVSIGPDGKTLYLVSDRPGGYGGRDIYVLSADDKGNWGDAQNLGPVINTPYDEEGVTIQADGRTLYFSSRGHNTMGGYDIFSSYYDANGEWEVPLNIGYPINTPDDDVFFCMAANGKHAYYSSVRKGGQGETDIYRITFLGDSIPTPNKNSTINVPKLTLLKGIVTDTLTHKPIEASVELVNNDKSSVIASFTSNSVTGKYLVSLPSGVNYGIAVKAPGYLFYSANFDIPDTSKYAEVIKNIALQPLAIGSNIILKNIFFDEDKSTLRAQSKLELDRLINLLKTNPTLKIEILGYCDSKGSNAYNQKLSEARSKSVIDYLVVQGIALSRLSYKGYGEERPIASNATEEGRQLNRRTEVKIVGK